MSPQGGAYTSALKKEKLLALLRWGVGGEGLKMTGAEVVGTLIRSTLAIINHK